jgi:predicted metal-dependent peptidase
VGPDGKYKFHPLLWNIATDYVINAMLVESKIGKSPKGGLLDSRFDGSMLADDVYRALVKDQPPSGGGGDGGGGEGESESESGGKGKENKGGDGKSGHGGFDVHIMEMDGTSKAEWKRAIKSAADAAKAVGKLPGGLSRYVDNLLNPVVPWQEKLRFSLQKVISRESHTWAKLHRRRYISQGIIFPGYTGFGAGCVVVAVDTSGSVGVKELTRFLSECDGILNDAKPSELWILGCDAAVHDATLLVQGDNLKDCSPPLKGGGGTSFIPPFEWVEQNGVRPAALVYLTDMYGPFPAGAPYPVIWCSTTPDKEAPFGETIQIGVENENQTV